MDGPANGRVLDGVAGLRHERVDTGRQFSEMRFSLGFSALLAGVVLLYSASIGWSAAAFAGGLLLYYASGTSVVVRLVVSRSMLDSASERARHALLAFSGGQLKPLDCSGTFVGTRCVGTGIGWDGRSLFVLDKGDAFEVPLALVREWRWVIEARNRVTTYGRVDVAVRMDVNQANMNDAARAYQSSGLFLEIADVRRPVLQFTCPDKQVLERWSEFLRQACDARAAEEQAAERESAEAQAERDRLAALTTVQGVSLGMPLGEAEALVRAAYDGVEEQGGGWRFVRGGDRLTIEADGGGRVARVSSEQEVEGSRAAVRASLERKYGPPLTTLDGRLEFAAVSRDGLPASLVADLAGEGGRVRLAVELALVTDPVHGLRL